MSPGIGGPGMRRATLGLFSLMGLRDRTSAPVAALCMASSTILSHP